MPTESDEVSTTGDEISPLQKPAELHVPYASSRAGARANLRSTIASRHNYGLLTPGAVCPNRLVTVNFRASLRTRSWGVVHVAWWRGLPTSQTLTYSSRLHGDDLHRRLAASNSMPRDRSNEPSQSECEGCRPLRLTSRGDNLAPCSGAHRLRVARRFPGCLRHSRNHGSQQLSINSCLDRGLAGQRATDWRARVSQRRLVLAACGQGSTVRDGSVARHLASMLRSSFGYSLFFWQAAAALPPISEQLAIASPTVSIVNATN